MLTLCPFSSSTSNIDATNCHYKYIFCTLRQRKKCSMPLSCKVISRVWFISFVMSKNGCMILSVVLKPGRGIQTSIDKVGKGLSIHLNLISLGYLNSIIGVRRALRGCWTKMRLSGRWFCTWYPFRGYLLLVWASTNSALSLYSVTQWNHRHCSATHTNQLLAWCGNSCGWRIVAT